MRRTTLYLFAIALATRAVLSGIRAAHGLQVTSIWLEAKDDFDGIYVQQLGALSRGEVPYVDVAISYPPLFLYSMYPFYLLGGANWASIPIVLSDAASAVIIYLCVEKLAGTRLGLAAGLVYALTPFALFYEGYVWFSSQPMAFFAILGFYLLMTERPVASLASLGASVMFKQEAIFLLPAFLGYVAYTKRDALVKSLAVFAAVLAGVSLPFLVTSAYDYLSLVTYGLVGRWPGQPPPEQVTSSAVCSPAAVTSSTTVMSCVFGTTSYTEAVNSAIAPSARLLDSLVYDIEVVSGFVAIPLLLLLVPVLYSLRRQRSFLPFLCAYSGIAFLIAFSVIFHPVYRYYYLPVYMFMLMASSNRKTLIVSAASTVLSLLTPSGEFQELFPVLCLLTMSAFADSSASAAELAMRSQDWA